MFGRVAVSSMLRLLSFILPRDDNDNMLAAVAAPQAVGAVDGASGLAGDGGGSDWI